MAVTRLCNTYNKVIDTPNVVDVSDLTPEGKGFRTILAPKSAHNKRKQVENIPVVSDNYETYALAMQFLGAQFACYAEKYLMLYGKVENKTDNTIKTTKETHPSIKLIETYNSVITAGKVIDVSDLQPDGRGFRTMPAPKTSRGKKKRVDNIPVISDNYETFALAMALLGPDFATYATKYLELYGRQLKVVNPNIK